MLKINKISCKNGFSLIELMVSVAILAIAIFGIFHAYSAGFMGMADAKDITMATNYAREKMEEIKNKSFEIIEIGGIRNTNETKEEKYLISTNIKNESIDGEEKQDLQRVIITVSWDDRNEQTKTVMLETLIYNND